MAVIEARNVSKRFFLHRQAGSNLKVEFLDAIHGRRRSAEEFWALKDVTFDIEGGEAVGLVGRNGSGKSTLLKAIAGIHTPTLGHLRVPRAARIGTIIELGVGFHHELSGRENVFINAAIHGLTRPEIEQVYPEVVEYSGLSRFIDLPLKTYSSGMYMRLGFAVAAMLRPDILLLDEVFAVGDEDFQRQCLETMKEFGDRGTTVVFVSHSPEAVKAICRRVLVFDAGRFVFDGHVREGLDHYHALVRSAGADGAAGGGNAFPAAVDTEEQLDAAWHRRAVGGHWRAAGEWQYDFLRRQGLAPTDYLLDVGCGSLAGARVLLPFMEPGHYCGFETERTLFEAGVAIELDRAGVAFERGRFIINDSFDLSESTQAFDMAVANSLLRRLPLNRVARCISNVMPRLKPGGRFFLTWLDNLDPCSFEPIVRSDSVVSYPDAEPFHYSYEMLALVCRSLGYHVERLPCDDHPRGESLMVLTAGPSVR